MTEEKELTYSVIITISLPGESGETSLHLTLGPADQVPVADGSRRLLQDCTLAELQQFADALETELWQDYLDATLVDLVVDDALRIDFAFDHGDDDLMPSGELLLDHVVLFPKDRAQAEVAIGEQPSTPDLEPESREEQPAGIVQQTVGTTTQVGSGERQAQPLEDVDSATAAEQPETQDIADASIADVPVVEDKPEAHDVEAEVTVAESEPVHEERELLAEPEPPAVPVPTRVRILGRRRPLGHRTSSAVDILINEPAFRDAQAHAISSPDREVAGVLVGPPPEKQPDGRYVVHISDMIIAKHTRMQGASVTYTPESWRYVNDRLAAMYPDDTAVIVGWYHTHPGFGIFLSGMDRFIHHNFFTQLWHVALVLDPLARRSGFFSWNRAKTQVDVYEFPWPNWAANSW